jgi:hypothetical protein
VGILNLIRAVVGIANHRFNLFVKCSNIHYPTDSTLQDDGVRVLTRTMKKITKIAGAVGTKLCDRNRSVKFRLLEIGRIARAKARGDQSGQDEAVLRPAFGCNQSGGGPSKAGQSERFDFGIPPPLAMQQQ